MTLSKLFSTLVAKMVFPSVLQFFWCDFLEVLRCFLDSIDNDRFGRCHSVLSSSLCGVSLGHGPLMRFVLPVVGFKGILL